MRGDAELDRVSGVGHAFGRFPMTALVGSGVGGDAQATQNVNEANSSLLHIAPQARTTIAVLQAARAEFPAVSA